jgi:hypothetical protein
MRLKLKDILGVWVLWSEVLSDCPKGTNPIHIAPSMAPGQLGGGVLGGELINAQ